MNKQNKTLTTSLPVETQEKLRTLAGGPRKVGFFLTGVIDLIWRYRDLLATDDLADLRLTTADKYEQHIAEQWRQIRELETAVQGLREQVKDTLQEIREAPPTAREPR